MSLHPLLLAKKIKQMHESSSSITSVNVDNDSRYTILIVDDTPQNLAILGELLKSHYRVRVANSGENALRAANSDPRPDLILLDVMMPGMSGHEVIRRLRGNAETKAIPVIFITAMVASEDEEYGLELGAVDYITKPFNPSIVLARVRTQLELKQARDRLAQENDWLEREVARRMRENSLIQDLSVRALACLAEARDNETGQHIVRTQIYVDMLARYLVDHERFRDALAGPKLGMIVKASPLHDLGKVGIPDSILLKPGRLTPEEFEIMKTHTTIGAHAITKAMEQSLAGADESVAELAGGAFEFLSTAREISLGHQEKWDGSGYPNGASGEAIPVSARLMALADVFDALMSRRVYKPPMTLDEATKVILDGRGTHFDPAVVDAFMACRERFAEVAARYADPE
jgi:putative two-component system response regulator